MHGKGADFLRQSFDILLDQTYKDFDVVISDNASDDSIKNVCDEYAAKLPIRYYKNSSGNDMCNNMNNAFVHAEGSILKILFMDDFLLGNDSLAVLAQHFDLATDHWIATACTHTKDGKTFFSPHLPSYNNFIQYGNNTIGTPSIIAVKNENLVFFDPKFKWTLNDCDYYKSNYDRFGPPKILDAVTVAVRHHEHSITNTRATTKARYEEFLDMLKKRNETIFSHPKIFFLFIKIWAKHVIHFFA